eukprot:1160920-Pelagomonas_calceolata.AAC.7
MINLRALRVYEVRQRNSKFANFCVFASHALALSLSPSSISSSVYSAVSSDTSNGPPTPTPALGFVQQLAPLCLSPFTFRCPPFLGWELWLWGP